MEDQKNKIAMIQNENNASESIPSFLLKTYEILENEKYSDIISWTQTGEGFIVKKLKEFSQNILPIYFRHSNYTSFVRQLNMYDFHKTRQQNHQNAFKNILFKKGSKHLLKDILRKDYKKNKDIKDGNTQKPMSIQKCKEYSKADKNEKLNSDTYRLTLSKMLQLNSKLEKKVISLAEIREIPFKNVEILKLLDSLFDAKKIHKEIVEKLSFFSVSNMQEQERKTNKYLSFQNSCQKQCPTTQGKASMFQLGKQQRQPSTNCFLTFSQI